MSKPEGDPISRLNAGYYAFSSKGKVVELEIIEHVGKRLSTEVLFSMSRLAQDDTKEVIIERGSIATDLNSALRNLGRESFQAVSSYATEKAEREDRIQEVNTRAKNYERARSRTARTGEIPAEYVLFKSDRM